MEDMGGGIFLEGLIGSCSVTVRGSCTKCCMVSVIQPGQGTILTIRELTVFGPIGLILRLLTSANLLELQTTLEPG